MIRIVPTAGMSERGDRSYVEDMCRVAKTGQDVTLNIDEFCWPLPAGVLTRALWELLVHDWPGLYHLGGRERLSRWEIGQVLLQRYPELNGHLAKGSPRGHRGAPRLGISLQCEKIQGLLSFPLPGMRDWLASRSDRGGDLWDYARND